VELIAWFDSVNTIQQVFDKKFIDGSCEFAPRGVAHGRMRLKDYDVTTDDSCAGTSLKDGTTYYYR